MTTTTLKHEIYAEALQEAKARRNAEYLAKIDKAFCEVETGRSEVMAFEEWEKMFCND